MSLGCVGSLAQGRALYLVRSIPFALVASSLASRTATSVPSLARDRFACRHGKTPKGDTTQFDCDRDSSFAAYRHRPSTTSCDRNLPYLQLFIGQGLFRLDPATSAPIAVKARLQTGPLPHLRRPLARRLHCVASALTDDWRFGPWLFTGKGEALPLRGKAGTRSTSLPDFAGLVSRKLLILMPLQQRLETIETTGVIYE